MYNRIRTQTTITIVGRFDNITFAYIVIHIRHIVQHNAVDRVYVWRTSSWPCTPNGVYVSRRGAYRSLSASRRTRAYTITHHSRWYSLPRPARRWMTVSVVELHAGVANVGPTNRGPEVVGRFSTADVSAERRAPSVDLARARACVTQTADRRACPGCHVSRPDVGRHSTVWRTETASDFCFRRDRRRHVVGPTSYRLRADGVAFGWPSSDPEQVPPSPPSPPTRTAVEGRVSVKVRTLGLREEQHTQSRTTSSPRPVVFSAPRFPRRVRDDSDDCTTTYTLALG